MNPKQLMQRLHQLYLNFEKVVVSQPFVTPFCRSAVDVVYFEFDGLKQGVQ